jgi:hypothetical protein
VASFHAIWQEWHIYNAHNYVIHEDGERYQMLDGVEDWVRRSLSERRLRELQAEFGWSNAHLVEIVRGDHDGNDTHDEEIYDRLSYNGLEGEAAKYIPASELDCIVG